MTSNPPKAVFSEVDLRLISMHITSAREALTQIDRACQAHDCGLALEHIDKVCWLFHTLKRELKTERDRRAEFLESKFSNGKGPQP